MPISLEQWRAAVGRWVGRIQRTLIIRRGVKRSPPCASNQEWESPSGQSHSGERKCTGKRKGRKKYKEDPVNDPAIASDEFYDGVIVLAVPLMSCGTTVSKDCSDGNTAGSLKELFGWTALGAFLVIMLLLLRSGDVEPNPGPAERGAHTLLSISSTPTLHELDKLTVSHAASQWEAVAPHLVVESCGVCKFGSGHLDEASRGVLSRWLKGESNTDIAEKTRCSVLEAHEANGSIHIAEQLKLFEESSGEPVTGHASPPGVFGTGRRHQCMSPTTTAGPHVRGHPPGDLAHAGSVHTPFGSNEIHGPDGKIAQQGAHTLLSISSTPTLHELGKLTVCHAASQWEEVAPHLVVESCGVCNIIGSGLPEEASRGSLSRWLKGESDTDIAEKTKHSVLEAQEASRNIPLAKELKLFEESSEEPVTGLASPPDPIRPRHLSCDLLNELSHFDLIVDCLCCHFGEWMKAGPTRSDLSCPLSDGVPVTPLSPDLSTHSLTVKSSTVINAFTRRMAALITFLLWQMALVALAFLLFLLEVTAANLDKMKAWWKAGLSSGNNYISSQCKKMRTLKSICVQCPLNLQMTVMTKYRYQAASQQLCGLLAKLCVFLRELLLLAGDVEANPGPIQVEEILSEFREQFISDVDVNMVVMKLLNKDIISDGVRESIERAGGPIHRSEILHEHLMRTCTDEAFRTVCAIIASVRGNPKMSALGKDMQRSLESGVSSRGRHEVMVPLTSAAAHSSGQSHQIMGHAPGIPGHVDRREGGAHVGLSLTMRKHSEEFQKFSSRMQTQYARMKVVVNAWRKPSPPMNYVKLALSRFKLDFEDEQKKFVEAISDPEGVDKVYTVVKTAKIDYKDIPTMVKEKKLVIISGAPGVGKSTLAKKLCQDISNKISDHKYDLVLLVELRDLIEFKDLAEPFKLHHLFQLFTESTQVAAQLARELQAHDGKGVLLILDGYDELLQELREAPFFIELLAHSPKSPLPECDIVLTSRSIVTSQIYHHLVKASTSGDVTNVEVLGFTKAQVKHYAQLYFDAEGMKPLCPQFLAKLESVPQIYSLCSIPVVLLIVCRVYLAKKDLPPTLTEAYNDFVFEKVLLNSPDIDVDSLLHLPPTHDFYQLCEIAFSCFVDQKVIFTSAELKDLSARYSNRESGCGLLTARPVDKLRCILAAVDSFFFIHQTVQEFLSALHICRQEVAVQKEIWAKYLGQPRMAQVWKFFSGLSKLDNFDALELAPKLDDEEVLVQSLYESQNEAVVAQVIPVHFGPDPKVKLVSVHSSIAHGYCFQQFRSMNSLEVVGRLNTNVQISSFLEPVLSALRGAVLQHLAIRKFRPKDWIEAAEVLKKLWHSSPQVDDDHSADEGCSLHGMPSQITLEAIPVDVLCEIWEVLDDVEHLTCERVSDPHKTLSSDLLSKMTLAQNKTIQVLKLTGADVRHHGLLKLTGADVRDCRLESKILEGKAKGDLTQYPVMKQLMNHIQLGVLKNTTLERVELDFPPWLSGCIKRNDSQQHLESITLNHVRLDVVCDVVEIFEHMKELQCMGISDPQQSLSLDLLNKMSTSLAQNKTMVKLRLDSGVYGLENSKPFIRHLLLGLNGNNTLTDLTLNLPLSWWDWPEGNLVQRSVERVSLRLIPLDFVCEALEFFGHVEELECIDIRSPQQSGVAEDGLKLEELEGILAGHESLKKLRFHFNAFRQVPQTLVQKFGVAAVRGVARNKGIAEFKLEPWICDQKVVDDILAQLTPDERRKFRVGKDGHGRPSIELFPVGDPSSGGAPPSTDLQSISEDAVMDLDRPEHFKSGMTSMIAEEEEEEEEESLSPAEKIRKLQNDEEEGDGTGVSEDHSKATSSSATAAVNQRDDTAVSSSYSGSSIDEDCSAPLTPPSFTRVGGAPHWGETSAGTDLSYIHSQTAKYLMKATVRPKEKDPSVVRETSSPFPTEPAVGGDGEPITQGGSLSTALRYVPLDSLCWRLCNLAQAKELNCDSIIDPQQSLSLDLLNKMATLLAHNETLKRLELRSDSLTQYNDAKRFTQHLLLGAAGSTTLTEVCIGFSSWWRDCHIQSGHVAGSVQKVTMWGAPLDVLCDLLPVFEHVEQLVCLDIKDPQESNMTMAALKLNEVERVLTGCTQLKTILFECCWLQSTPELFFSLCISSLLKGAARNKNITSVQLAHSEEHQQQVEEVLTYLLTDLSVEERRRIGRGQCTLESGLVCPCIEVLPVTDSRKGKRSATEGAPFLPKKGRDCSD